MIDTFKLNEIFNKLITKFAPNKIILFGSYAKGTPNEDSDIDLLIIKDLDLPKHKRNIEIRKYFFGYKIPMDIIVYTKSEYESELQNKSSFINEILKSGKIIYEQ